MLNAFTTADNIDAAMFDGGTEPPAVKNLKPEDVPFHPDWWKDGSTYLRWLNRVMQAYGSNPKPMYIVVNEVQDNYRLPEYDRLHDVTKVRTQDKDAFYALYTASTYAWAAILALGFTEDRRQETIGNVVPHIYLTGSRRRVVWYHWVAGLFSPAIRTRNKAIRQFRKCGEWQRALHRVTGGRMGAMWLGYTALLKDIAAGRELTCPDNVGESTAIAVTVARQTNPATAQAILDHLRIVMTETERHAIWPGGS